MKIISWNTNGLRATVKQGYFIPLFIFNPVLWKLIGLITGILAMICLVKFGFYYNYAKKALFLFQHPSIAIVIVFSCIPSILAVILFFPRIHYIAIIVYALLILICPVKLKH